MTTSNVLRRMSKRRRLRSLLIAAYDELEHGVFEPDGGTWTTARHDGYCPACGGLIEVGDNIVHCRRRLRQGTWQLGWTHAECPSRWSLLATCVESVDSKIITKVSEGRGYADCGHNVDGRNVYLVRPPVPLGTADGICRYECEECVT